MSNKAIVCIHNSAQGRDILCPGNTMIAGDLRVYGEFYVTPADDSLIAEGGKIACDSIGPGGSRTYGRGTLADLATFFALPLSRQATDGFSQAGSKT